VIPVIPETKEDLAVYLWDDGLSLKEISEEMGISEKEVRRYLNVGGVEVDNKPIDPNGNKAAAFKWEWLRVTRMILGGK
jgi:hypothetical protein